MTKAQVKKCARYDYSKIDDFGRTQSDLLSITRHVTDTRSFPRINYRLESIPIQRYYGNVGYFAIEHEACKKHLLIVGAST